MCGIHGFISGNTKDLNADDFMKSGFVAGSLRGMDSSGVASILVPKKTFAFQKLPVAGSTFIQDKYADTLIRRANDSNVITIGHTRSATVGKVGYSEAHPFYIEEADREMVGVHNGTLTNWRSHSNAKDFDVDSDWALNQIFDEGKEAFTKFGGAYCFVWWDSNESDTLNIALNSERPMHIALTEKGNLALASEAGMLYWLLERHSVKLKGAVRSLSAGHWYKFKTNDVENYTKEELPKQKNTTTTTTTYHNQGSYYGRRDTVVDNVTALLARISTAKTSAPDTTAPTQVPLLPAPTELRTPEQMNQAAARSNIMVLHNEQQTARDLAMMNERGSFVPVSEDTELGITHGTFCQADMEYDAIIRRVGIDWTPDSVWMVSVIGAQDTDNNTILVCGGPHFTMKPKTAAINGTHVVH